MERKNAGGKTDEGAMNLFGITSLGISLGYRLPAEWDGISAVREYRRGRHETISRGEEKSTRLDGERLDGNNLPALAGSHGAKVGCDSLKPGK